MEIAEPASSTLSWRAYSFHTAPTLGKRWPQMCAFGNKHDTAPHHRQCSVMQAMKCELPPASANSCTIEPEPTRIMADPARRRLLARPIAGSYLSETALALAWSISLATVDPGAIGSTNTTWPGFKYILSGACASCLRLISLLCGCRVTGSGVVLM